MKKYLILALTAALAAVGCSKTFDVVPTPTNTTPIGFGTWAEHLTKADPRPAGTNDFLAGDTFNVYGYKTVATTKTVVFNGDVVTADGTEGDPVSTWSYSPIRFWDPTAASYTFFAVSPSGNVSTANAETGVITSNDITFGGQNNDILVATKKEVTTFSSAPVQIVFNHIASLVDIKVKKDAALPTSASLKITAASLTNVQTKGQFTVASYDSNGKPVIGATAYGWTLAETPVPGSYTANASLPLTVNVKTSYDANDNAATGTTDDGNNSVTVPNDVQNLFTNYVLMPQDIQNGSQNLHIEYKIVTQVSPEIATEYTADIPIKNFVTADDKDNPTPSAATSWIPGTHYIYTLTIGANAISFSASINPWNTTTVNGYHYLLQ